MNVEIVEGPGNPAAIVKLNPGETVTAEGGSMIAMRGNFGVETTTQARGKGSILGGLKRMLSGQSFFLNHFTADSNGGEIYFATTLPGDMYTMSMTGPGIICEGGSFVVKSEGVNLDMSWQGLKSAFSGESLFWVRLSGNGQVVLSSFGAIYPIDIDGEYIVDTGHIVAFEETLNFSISKAGSSWISSFLGGEGFVCRFKGRGRLWCQSHHAPEFGRILGPLLKPR